MANAFNNDKGKVDIDAIISGLQTTFQNNVNTIYNAIVNTGITPTAKTPAACSTGIGNIVNTIYNAFVNKGVTPTAKTTTALSTAVTTTYNKGVNDQKAVTWTEKLYLDTTRTGGDDASLQMDAKNITKIKLISSSAGFIVYRGYGSVTPTQSPITEVSTTINDGQEITLKSDTKSISLYWGALTGKSNYTLQITRKCSTRY